MRNCNSRRTYEQKERQRVAKNNKKKRQITAEYNKEQRIKPRM
jgi:hypothetical protein